MRDFQQSRLAKSYKCCKSLKGMPAQQLVKGVIVTEGKMLLLRKSHFVQNPGMWDLPSGMLAGKESPMQGMIRVIKECLGVDATNLILRS